MGEGAIKEGDMSNAFRAYVDNTMIDKNAEIYAAVKGEYLDGVSWRSVTFKYRGDDKKKVYETVYFGNVDKNTIIIQLVEKEPTYGMKTKTDLAEMLKTITIND